MLDSLTYSLNAVLPLVLIVTLGYLLRCFRLLPEAFLTGADKAVFRLTLPVYLFMEIYGAKGLDDLVNPRLIGLCMIMVAAQFVLLWVTVPLFIKQRPSRGAFIQGVYRANFAILGIPLAGALFGEDGVKLAVVLLSVAIPFYNITAVVVLSVNCENGQKTSALCILKGIVTNPLIIAVALGLVLKQVGLHLPIFAEKSLSTIAGMSTPLALLALGASFSFSELKGARLKLALWAVALKNLATPLIACAIAAILGFRNAELGIVFIMFGAPAAVSSFIMAKNMNSDYQLAGQIVLLTTVAAAGSIFAGAFALRTLNLI